MNDWCISPDNITSHFSTTWACSECTEGLLLLIRDLWKVWARWVPHRPLWSFKLHLGTGRLTACRSELLAAWKLLSWGCFGGMFARSSRCLSAYQLGEEQRQMWHLRGPQDGLLRKNLILARVIQVARKPQFATWRPQKPDRVWLVYSAKRNCRGDCGKVINKVHKS